MHECWTLLFSLSLISLNILFYYLCFKAFLLYPLCTSEYGGLGKFLLYPLVQHKETCSVIQVDFCGLMWWMCYLLEPQKQLQVLEMELEGEDLK